MEEILRSPNALRLFFIVTAGIGWATNMYEKNILSTVSATTLALLDSMLTVVALLVFILFKDGGSGVLSSLSELRALAKEDASVLGVLAVYGAGIGLVASSLLKHHSVDHYHMTGLFTSLAVGAIGMYMVGDMGLTWGRGVGLVFLGVGGYLLFRGTG